MMRSIKVLVIEPDALARLAIVSMLNSSTEVMVVGIASDPMQARMQIKQRKPQALILATDQNSASVHDFLTDLMQKAPLPVLMLSQTVIPGTGGERLAFRAGGVVLSKPSHGVSNKDQVFRDKLIQQIQSMVLKFKAPDVVPAQQGQSGAVSIQQAAKVSTTNTSSKRHHSPVLNKLLVLGASTGGTEAFRRVLSELPSDFSAVVIVQHIPKAFAAAFIQKLDRASAMIVVAATDGAEILHGHIYVGACDEHFRIAKQGGRLLCRVGGKDKINGHCPSVNELFDSVASQVGSKAVGALLTGMGDDGATGLKKMREAGARTVAQDKASSVVWGMPGSAVALDAAEIQVPLDGLTDKLIQLVK